MGTIASTNTIEDLRGDTLGKHPVWRSTVAQMVWASGTSATDIKNSTVYINGVIQSIKVTYSAATANPTAELSITDLDGNELTTTGEKADGGTHIWKADGTDFAQNQLAIHDGFIVKVEIEKDPSTSGLTADIEIVGI